MPASPDSRATWPSPAFALVQRRSKSSLSSSRPTSASARPVQRLEAALLALSRTPRRRAPVCDALEVPAGRGRLARTGRPELARALADDDAVGLGDPLSRAARFGVSPTTPRSCASPEPRRSPTTTIPVAMPRAHAAARRPMSQFRRGFDDREPGPHRAFGVVLVRLGIAEIRENAVAHIFGDEAPVRAINAAQQRDRPR